MLFDGFAIFRHVVECGGFSAAAEKLGHSTSFISKEVNKLEQRLDARLLNRTTRSISLTPEGKVFFTHCQQLVQDAEHVVNLIGQHSVKPVGRLKISCPTSLGLRYLQPILSEYRQLYPDVVLELDIDDKKVDVIQDGYDLAIRATEQLEESSLICRKVLSSHLCTVASPSYLEKYGTPLTPHDLVDHQGICYANLKQPSRWHYKSKQGEKFSVDIQPSVISNNAMMEISMTVDGHGVCRMPKFNMEAEIESGKLVCLLEEYPKMTIDLYAVYPSRKHLSPKVRCLIDLLVSQTKQGA